MYRDTDDNGFFDLVEFDYNADRVSDLTVSITDYGTDVCELIDPSQAKCRVFTMRLRKMQKKYGNSHMSFIEFFGGRGFRIRQ
jgi:hypothetical protein